MKEHNNPGEDIRDMEHDMHKGHEMNHDEHAEHMKHNKHKGHDHMVADFRKQFCVSLIITRPILILSPVIQEWAGLGNSIRFSGDLYILFALSSVVFFYGGYPFLKGLFDDLKSSKPGDDDTRCRSYYNRLSL
jgi:Cu2+-exporting ATPase